MPSADIGMPEVSVPAVMLFIELMPINSPLALTSAPPLLPGLMAASVCIRWYV